jgi:hypothetical protein
MRIEDHDLKELITKDLGAKPSTDLVAKVLRSLPLKHLSTHAEPVAVFNGSRLILGRAYKSLAPLLLLLIAGIWFLVASHRHEHDEDLYHVDTLSLSTMLIL